MDIKKFFHKLYAHTIVGWRLFKGTIQAKLQRTQLTEKGLQLADYCSKIIMSNGEYQPVTFGEQMLEEFICSRYPEMDRLSAAGNMFIMLAPSLPKDWSGSLEKQRDAFTSKMGSKY